MYYLTEIERLKKYIAENEKSMELMQKKISFLKRILSTLKKKDTFIMQSSDFFQKVEKEAGLLWPEDIVDIFHDFLFSSEYIDNAVNQFTILVEAYIEKLLFEMKQIKKSITFLYDLLFDYKERNKEMDMDIFYAQEIIEDDEFDIEKKNTGFSISNQIEDISVILDKSVDKKLSKLFMYLKQIEKKEINNLKNQMNLLLSLQEVEKIQKEVNVVKKHLEIIMDEM